MKLNLRTLRRLLAVFLTFLILFETAAFIAMTPRPQDQFFEFYALGANRSADDYYPNNSTFIQTDEPVTWYLGVTNRMGSMQFIDIRVKLANQTLTAPNDTTLVPSSAPVVAEFKQFIQNNQTWEIPFIWQVLNFTTTTQGYSRILQLQIGNVTYSMLNAPTCSSLSSCSFRFIFELWIWNLGSSEFQFASWNGNNQQIVWLQLWFKITPGVP